MKLAISTMLLIVIAQCGLTGLHANTLENVPGMLSEGTTSLTLEVLPRLSFGTEMNSAGMQFGTHRLPEVLAESLLSDSRITIGVCLPHTYNEGFAVSPFSADDEAPHVSDLAGNPLSYQVSRSRDWDAMNTYVSVRDSGCVSSRSSKILINLNPLGRQQPRILLGKFNLLVQPE